MAEPCERGAYYESSYLAYFANLTYFAYLANNQYGQSGDVHEHGNSIAGIRDRDIRARSGACRVPAQDERGWTHWHQRRDRC